MYVVQKDAGEVFFFIILTYKMPFRAVRVILGSNVRTVVPGFRVLGFRALPGFRALCNGNQIWIYVINLPGFSALPGFKAPFHGDGQSALNPGTTVIVGQ